jgi:hypothetical protein
MRGWPFAVFGIRTRVNQNVELRIQTALGMYRTLEADARPPSLAIRARHRIRGRFTLGQRQEPVDGNTNIEQP